MTFEDMARMMRSSRHDAESWLVFADWLLEHGDQRGRLIQIEHEIHNNPDLTRTQGLALAAEGVGIKHRHEANWLHGWEPTDMVTLEWTGGFVTGINAYSAFAPGHGRLEETLAEFARSPASALWGELYLFGSLHSHSAPILRLAKAGALRQLRTFSVNKIRLSHEQLRELFCLGHLDEVVDIKLSQVMEGVPGTIAQSPRPPNLRRIQIWGNKICDLGVVELTQNGWLQGLEQLNVAYNELGPDSARALANCAGLNELKDLTLDSNSIGDEGVELLTQSEHLGRLGHLSVVNNGLSSGAIDAILSEESRLSSLRALNVSWNSRIPLKTYRRLRAWALDRDVRLTAGSI